MKINFSDAIMIIQSIIYLATLIVLLFQLKSLIKQTTDLSKNVEFNNISSLLSHHINVHKFLIERPKLSYIFAYHEKEDSEEKVLNDHYVMYMTDTFELFFILHQRRLIPNDVWEISLDNMKRVVKSDQRFELFWKMKYETLRGRFDEKFMDFMHENIIRNAAKENCQEA